MIVYLLDLLLWLFVQMPFAILSGATSLVHNFFAKRYYEIVRLRRWLKKEPGHQVHDQMIGEVDHEKYERYRVWVRELADHARGCDTCWTPWSSIGPIPHTELCSVGLELQDKIYGQWTKIAS